MATEESQFTMDQILSGEPVEVPEPAPETEPAPEVEAHEHETAAPQGEAQETAQLEQDGATAAPEGDELPPWLDPEKDPDGASNWRTLRENAKDFRRQAKEQAERAATVQSELEAMRAEVERIRAEAAAPPQPEPAPLPPVEEAPEAHIAALRQEMAAWRTSQLYDKSEILAIQRHGAEKVERAFKRYSALPTNDPLRVQLATSQDPWNLVVSELDRRDVLSEIGEDPSQYRAKVEAEVRAKVEAEIAAKATAEAADGVEKSIRERLPSSMAKVPGSGQNASAKDAWNGPAPIGEVIGGGLDRYS